MKVFFVLGLFFSSAAFAGNCEFLTRVDCNHAKECVWDCGGCSNISYEQQHNTEYDPYREFDAYRKGIEPNKGLEVSW